MFRPLTTSAEVEALIAAPTPVWLFKHSTACPISHAAYEQMEAFMAAHAEAVVGLVVIQQQRPLSSWIATRLNQTHKSPQVFLLVDGAVVWQASHWSITAATLAQALDTLRPAR